MQQIIGNALAIPVEDGQTVFFAKSFGFQEFAAFLLKTIGVFACINQGLEPQLRVFFPDAFAAIVYGVQVTEFLGVFEFVLGIEGQETFDLAAEGNFEFALTICLFCAEAELLGLAQ